MQKLHWDLQRLKNEPDKPFGGVKVVMMGNALQMGQLVNVIDKRDEEGRLVLVDESIHKDYPWQCGAIRDESRILKVL